MQLNTITPLILTYNEAPNLDRTLAQLTWATTIVVIDSYSTDATLEIVQRYPQIQLWQRPFDSFAAQCNFGLSQISSEWVLSLDADYVLSDQLLAEIRALPDDDSNLASEQAGLERDRVSGYSVSGYSARFKYCVFGQPLRGTLLPPRQVLYRRAQAIYHNDGHAHRVWINGTVRPLSGYIYHDDRKPLSRWLWAQDRYMVLEAKKLRSTPVHQLSWGDRLRCQTPFAPAVILLYCLMLKGGILDGKAGWYYALQRTLAEILLAIRLSHDEG
jgi:glycosyltransferase involved in cell wall biosynthesis